MGLYTALDIQSCNTEFPYSVIRSHYAQVVFTGCLKTHPEK